MKIVIAADHAGFELKNALAEHMRSLGHEVEDLGTDSSQSVDYPDFARAVGERLTSGQAERGVLVCGTGLGMAMTANKMAGVRAASVSDTFSAKMCRAHNDANVLALGSRVVGLGLAKELVEAYLETDFEGERHARRVGLIEAP
ncbi:MAG: ribose 5-phosphate isomerase B [Acidobacteriota bacterium]